MDIHIDLEAVKFFVVLVIAGSLYGWYCYKQGIKVGFDDAMYMLQEEFIVKIDDETLEVSRVSDHEFRKYKEEYENYSE